MYHDRTKVPYINKSSFLVNYRNYPISIMRLQDTFRILRTWLFLFPPFPKKQTEDACHGVILAERHKYPESHCVLLRHDMRKPQISRDGIAISDLNSLNLNHQYERTSCIVKKTSSGQNLMSTSNGFCTSTLASPYTP